ncbi:MAG: TauD/TfdA family dioxygenase [Myxococcota bacterium]
MSKENDDHSKLWDAQSLDPEQLVVNTQSVASLSREGVDELYRLFNRYGVVIVEHAPADVPEQEMIALGKLFGEPVTHDRADERGVVVIGELSGYGEFVGASSGPHLMHTGGTFMGWEDVPKVVLLQCEKQSRIGGRSLLASGAAAYRYMRRKSPRALEMLRDPRVFSIRRTFDGAGKYGKTGVKGKAVFDDRRLGTGRIWMSFRFDGKIKLDIAPDEAHEVYDELVHFFDRSENQIDFKLKPNQILVCDNTSVVHSRTAYQAGSQRKLNRLQLDGSRDELIFGFPEPPPEPTPEPPK